MTNDLDHRADHTAALTDDVDAPPAPRTRGHDANTKSVAVIVALVVAGTAVVVTALTGGGTSRAACEERVQQHVRAVLLGVGQAEAGRPIPCNGIPQSEVEQIRGRILGTAVA